jgi:prophage antirepressor-like protein
MKTNLAVKNIMRFFASELTVEPSIKVLIVVAFFVSACNIDSIGCCNPSDSRPKALLTVPKQGVQQSFFINTFLIRQMERSVKNATGTNNSSTRRTPGGATSAPTSKANEHGLQSFSFEGTHEVQVLMINNEPYFVAVDVCNILGLSNPSDRLKNTLEPCEYLPYVQNRAGQNRTVNVVSESGLYALIFQSRKPVAKTFRKWVTSEVLPSIRKTGYYGIQPGGYVTEQEYRHLEMMYGVEKRLCELLQMQRDYYVTDRDGWRNRAMDCNEMLLKFIINS